MFKKRAASEVLFRHVDGSGGRYELDDLVSSGHASDEDVVGPLMDINEEYRTDEYPIGLVNPDAFNAIRALAERLRAQGL